MTTKKKGLTKTERRDRRDNIAFGMSVLSLGIGVTSLALALNGRPDPDGLELASSISDATGIPEGEVYTVMCSDGWRALDRLVDARTSRSLRAWRRRMEGCSDV